MIDLKYKLDYYMHEASLRAIRRFFLILVAAFVVTASMTSLYYARVAAISAEAKRTTFGFTTHVLTVDGHNHTLSQFKQNVDLLAEKKQTWVRMDLVTHEIAPSGNGVTINWNKKGLSVYDEAINYARKRKLRVMIASTVPVFAKEYSKEDYQQVAKAYYGFLAKRYKGKVAIWQLFNEPNIHHFRDHSHNPALMDDPNYVSELKAVFQASSQAIKRSDKAANVTTSVSHWVGARPPEAFLSQTSVLFDALDESLDLITLNLFPDMSMEEIDRLPTYVKYFKEKYGKEVVIGEIGVSTKPGVGFTESDQARYMGLAIKSLKQGDVRPKVILFYELMDQTIFQSPLDHENYYGTLYNDGTKKSSFEDIVSIMQEEK